MIKEYTILLSDGKDIRYYLTKQYAYWEHTNWYFPKKRVFRAAGSKAHELLAYEYISKARKIEDLYWFNLKEAERLLKKFKKKIKNKNKEWSHKHRNKNYRYADGCQPFIIKKTKVKNLKLFEKN